MTELEGQLDIFGPLGNGFPIEDKEEVLLIGGGVGVPPLYETAKQYLSKNARVTVVLGANDADSVFYVDEFKTLGCDVYVATMDGSLGTKGTALDVIKENNVTCPFVLSCGPLPMLKAINEQYSEGYISLEARMACGLGACMGCVVKDVEDIHYVYVRMVLYLKWERWLYNGYFSKTTWIKFKKSNYSS